MESTPRLKGGAGAPKAPPAWRSGCLTPVGVAVLLAIFLLWLLHISELLVNPYSGLWSSGSNSLALELRRKRLSCELIFNGFFAKHESAWGTVKMAELSQEWERLKCQSLVVTCEKLALATLHEGRGGGMLKTMWEALECKGNLRTAKIAEVAPSTPVALAAATAAATATAATAAATAAAAPRAVSAAPAAPSPAPQAPSLPLDLARGAVSAASGTKTALGPVPPPAPVAPSEHPTSLPVASLAAPTRAPAPASTATTTSTAPAVTATAAATPSTTATANKRDKYNIPYLPPPAPYTEDVLHWCLSARDKHKVFANETHALPKVLAKLDKSLHERWRSQGCHEACVAAEEWERQKEKLYVKLIAGLPSSREKRVVSFSLYGSNPKYTVGAVRNAEMVGTYFPGWVCRFYVASVPEAILSKLKSLGAEVIPMTNYGNMLSRFLVAADPTVDRYIVRDTDSRLNQRDRMAVEEWIDSGAKTHSIRDHVNHCHPLMGGMWGGVKGAIPGFEAKVQNLMRSPMAKEYMTDMHFLKNVIWPFIDKTTYQHDTYCCKQFPNTHPLPTRRPLNYLHVGQIFDEFDNPVMMHIENHIRDVPNPPPCRDPNHPDWIYG